MASDPSCWMLSSKLKPSQEGSSKPLHWLSDLTKPRVWTAGQSRRSEPSCPSNGTSWRQFSGDVSTSVSGRKEQPG
eukprot:3931124-Heterocapsa_arctica.AAC.1